MGILVVIGLILFMILINHMRINSVGDELKETNEILERVIKELDKSNN